MGSHPQGCCHDDRWKEGQPRPDHSSCSDPALHQDYTSDFQLRRVNDIVPTLTSPILVGIASSMHLPGRPMMPEEPETPEVREGLHGGGGALTQSAAPGPSHLGEPMETEGEKPLGVRTIDLDATILADLPEDPADIVILDENSDMALSHVRKHLDLQFVCGGCFSQSFLNGPALNKHMRTCASVTAIRDCSNR